MNKKQMFDRDNHECYACGTTRDLTEQHRLNRKMGGRHGAAHADINRASRRITMCLEHNLKCEADADFQNQAILMGWKLREHENPLKIAAYHVAFREWRLLDDDGDYALVDGREPVIMHWEAADDAPRPR